MMFNKKEITIILILSIVLAGSVSFGEPIKNFSVVFASFLFLMAANVVAKKIVSYYVESEIEMKIWEIQRIGFYQKTKFPKPVPIGAILPLVVSILTIKRFYWLACMVFDVKPKTYRAVKRHGFYSFSEMTEFHIALIAASGIAVNLFLGIAGYLIGFEEFAKLNVYYVFFNLLPLSDLDGNKIFFGSLILWSLLAVLTLVGLGYVFLVI